MLPVADYLIAQGHGTRRTWNAAKHDLPKFIEQSINNLIRSTGMKHNKTYGPNVNAKLSNSEGYYSPNAPLDDAMLLIGIESHECGWFRMGAITRKLERTAKGLGAAFYAAVLDSLHEVGWVYCYANAEQNRDYQIEGIEDENGKTWAEMNAKERDEYEVIDPEDAFPKFLHPVRYGGFTKQRRALLRKHKAKEAVAIVLEMGELAAKLHPYGRELAEGDPMPSYAIYIEDHDPITAAFDEWGSTALEGDVTYHWQRTFKATPELVAKTFEAFTLAVQILAAASRLSYIVNGAK